MNHTAASTPDAHGDSVHADVRFLKGALPADGGRVPFLLRLEGRMPESEAERTPIDLALVLDRSGSMNGEPLTAAKMAAHDAVDLLEDGDRIAIVVYDGDVEVLVPTTVVDDRAALHDRIERIVCGGSTALHAGWVEGAEQLVDLLDPSRTARVVLLTDGQANVGKVDPEQIAADVARMAAHGVATSAIGLGRHFNEDLLARVTEAGRGRFQHAETPAQLEGVMAAELIGIDATVGRRVRARFAADGVAAEVADVLNDGVTDGDTLVLPDLVAEMPLTVAGVLHVRPAKPHLDRSLGTVELSWTDVGGRRRSARVDVGGRTLTSSEYAAAPDDPEVAIAVAVLTAARHRLAAMRALDAGDERGVNTELSAAETVLASAPDVERVQRERASLERVRQASATATGTWRASASAPSTPPCRRTSTGAPCPRRAASPRSRRRWRHVARRARSGATTAARIPPLLARRGTMDGLSSRRMKTRTGSRSPAPAAGSARSACGPRRHHRVARRRDRQPDQPRHARQRAVGRRRRPPRRRDGAQPRVPLDRARRPGPGGRDPRLEPARGLRPPHGRAHVRREREGLQLLAACYRAAFDLAGQLRLSRVAVPAIGTGTNRFPTGPAAEVAVRAVLDALARDGDPREIDIVLFDDATHRVFQRTLRGELSARRTTSPAA